MRYINLLKVNSYFLKDSSRDLIVNEINYVIKKMDQSKEPSQKLYYFSGVPGIIQRIFNIDYEPHLVFVHLILHSTHEAFVNRLQALQKGADDIIPLVEEQFTKLTETTKELGGQIKKNKDINNTLQKYAILAYSTTGNGYYLLQKGLLKI